MKENLEQDKAYKLLLTPTHEVARLELHRAPPLAKYRSLESNLHELLTVPV